MRKRSRLHVTSVGGKRTTLSSDVSFLGPFSCIFLSELSGKHVTVFAMNFSSIPNYDGRDLAVSLTYFFENTQVRSGDAVSPGRKTAGSSPFSSHSFNVCNRTTNRRHTHCKVNLTSNTSHSLLIFLSISGLSVTMLRSRLNRGSQNTQDSSPSWLSSKLDLAQTQPSTFA